MKRVGKIVITALGGFFQVEGGDMYEILNPEMIADSESIMRQSEKFEDKKRTNWQDKYRNERDLKPWEII